METEGNKNKNNNLSRQNGIWWKPAVEIFSEISTWIAVPIILAVIGGKALDERYGTKPYLLLVLSGVAFLFSAYGIVKAVKKYAAKIKKEEEKK
ncbi:MAG: AtpZ/AtpI family protein [Candidatus Paceibacterota bacterium]